MWKKDTRPLRSSIPAPIKRPDVSLAALRSRKLLRQRALVSAAASAIPVPGLDWAADAALLSKLFPRINEEFGLTPEQLDSLTPGKREQVQKAIAMVGSVLIGKFITRDLVLRMTRVMGMRLSTKQAARYVPLVGQIAAAAIGYATLRYLGERHIQDCIRVVEQAELDIPQRLRKARAQVFQSEQEANQWGQVRQRIMHPHHWSQPDRGPWKRSSPRSDN
ncbi:MAG: hypothetical protein LBJ15_22960 [Comamonas sp.]|jgi:uncharacterized protein (DUF697 family)|uniref:hypothetical protein n=1 Tax=Comamonas sp. TaxID=34028 RepID=UPI002824A41D|nr:hypothetical protein [Comamonas sp.]MDR0216846.1 hypothetical protein [Comamonas sp.]